MLWRVDADGLAFLFARSINPRHPVCPETLMKPMHPGKVLRLDILISPSALVGSVAITLRTGLSTGEALFGGILAMLLYWLSNFVQVIE